jgi:hypothetical protein
MGIAIVLFMVQPGVADLLSEINDNRAYTAFDLTGRTQQASHASFSLDFPGSLVSLQTGLISFAGPFPSVTVFDTTYSGFNDVATLLTDNNDEILRTDFELWLPNGDHQQPGVSGGSAVESIKVQSRSNLIGATISSVELEIGFMSHRVNGTSESLAINARWHIIGVPVPEPSASFMIAVAVVALVLRPQAMSTMLTRGYGAARMVFDFL